MFQAFINIFDAALPGAEIRGITGLYSLLLSSRNMTPTLYVFLIKNTDRYFKPYNGRLGMKSRWKRAVFLSGQRNGKRKLPRFFGKMLGFVLLLVDSGKMGMISFLGQPR